MATEQRTETPLDTSTDPSVVCVNAYGEDLIREGRQRTVTKSFAHRYGVLHRALSVFLFDADRRVLLQQRHPAKYHSGNLWSNTCCSHPLPGEMPLAAAKRRLLEEMGIECELEEVFTHLYRASLGDFVTEHEFDHVFFGFWKGDPEPDPIEVQAWRWVSLTELFDGIHQRPEAYTLWLRQMISRVESFWRLVDRWAEFIAGSGLHF